MNRKILLKLLSVTLIIGLVAGFLTPGQASAEPASPQAAVTVDSAVMDEMNKSGSATYWVDFSGTTDLSKASSMSWADRGWFVYDTLKAEAEKTQASVSAYLSNAGVSFDSFWIKNTILVKNSDKVVLNALQYLPNVKAIRATHSYILYEPEKDSKLIDMGGKGVEPNIAHVLAPDAWALGYTGEGLVVSSIDTGVRYTHQALVNQYRGNNGGTFTHDYNWFDPYGNYTVPTDANGHGTHTMGTMVGDDGGSNQIGIAPGAQWMACRGCSTSSCTDTALLTCAQFIAAPTTVAGTNPNPSMRPNVVNNSWGDCSTSYDNWYQDVVNAWQASGIYPVFSNGNASNCGYSAPPGLNTVGNPARYGNVTGVGSSGEQNGQYATHSNWGPTDNPDTINPTDGFDLMKPQVIAPGVSIRSSVPTNDSSYEDGWSGTSMSAPHVTGLVALMWQAAPCLVGDYAVTENLMEASATDITYNDGSSATPTDFPNYATGWGEINALAAVQAAAGLCGNSILTGTVTSDSAVPLEGARIEITGASPSNHRVVMTNASGVYSANVNADTYAITASLIGFESASVTGVVVGDGATVTQDFQLVELPNTLVTGVVYDGGIEGTSEVHGIPLAAQLTFSMTGYSETVETNPLTGEYAITLYHGQEYDVKVEAIPSGYLMLNTTITPSDTDPYIQDYTLYVNNVSCSAPGYGPDYDLMFDFEGSNQGFISSGTNSSWAWGDFTSGPNAGHSGTKGIATNPAGNYNASELSYMTSAPINLTAAGTSNSVIEFWQWRHIESATFDNGTVEVTKNGGTTWTAVYGPMGGVTDTAYNKVQIVLDPSYNVSNFQMRFKFKSDTSVQYEGWYIDDIGFYTFTVPPATQVFSTNFDADNGGFVASGTNSTWAWGAPTSGPNTPYSPPNVWATNLAGYYNNSEESYITSPVIDLSAYAGNAPSISFAHWYSSESNTYDYGSVEASKDGGTTWVPILQKFGTSVSPWAIRTLPLDPSYAVSNFKLRFHFHSDSSVNSYYGWYIDDVRVLVSAPYTISVPCVAINGGYVAGHVYDENYPTTVLAGASVVSDTAGAVTDADGLYWMFQRTTSDPEDVVFTASLPKYVDRSDTISVAQDTLNIHDFFLPAGMLSTNPTSLTRTIFLHDDPETSMLNVINNGGGAANISLTEKDKGFTPLALNLPAFSGELEKSAVPSSIMRDPNAPKAAGESSLLQNKDSLAATLATPPAFAVDIYNDNLVHIPDLATPGIWETIGSVPTALYAGDFLGDDFSKIYAIDDANTFYTIDVATGTPTVIGTVTPPSGESITGISGADGFFYGLSTACGGGSTLFTLDPETGDISIVGTNSIGCGIDLAYVPDQEAIYVVDLINDSTFRVDPATAEATELGSTGVAANYAQGMDYDEESGVLYWAAYSTSAELRVIDMVTGASALIGAFPTGEVDSFAIPTGGGADVPWLSEAPVEGTIAGHTTLPIAVTFDVATIEQPGDYFAELKVKHDTPYAVGSIPVTLHVIRPFNWGNFKGDVVTTEKCDLDPHPLADATINFIQGGIVVASTTTDANGHYSYSLLTGTYDIQLVSAGYVTRVESSKYLGPSMDIVVDFTTRLNQPCLSVEPMELAFTQLPDEVHEQPLVFTNTGAHEAVFDISEIAGVGPIIDSDIELVLDDGSAEDGIGIGGTLEFIFLNRFTPDPELFPFNLDAVQVYWDSANVSVGDEFQIAIYQNTSGSEDPAVGAELLYKKAVTASVMDDFETYMLDEPVALEGPGDVLIGVVAMEVPGSSYYPAAIDETASQGRSWAGWWLASPPPDDLVLPPDDTWMLIDDAGYPGNWLVRGLGSAGATDIIWLTEDPIAGVVPPDGGTTEVTLTYDSTGLTPGRYTGKLSIANQPDPKIVLPVTLNVSAPANYGYLGGTVEGMEVCNVNPTGLKGALVDFVQDGSVIASSVTKLDGTFKIALPAGIYDIEVTATGFEPKTRSGVVLLAEQTRTVYFSLRILAPCLTVIPGSLEKYLLPDTTGTQQLQILNTGAAEGLFEIKEIGVLKSVDFTPPTYAYHPELDLPGLDKSKTSTATPQAPKPQNAVEDVLISEGFEVSVPPADWTSIATNPVTWVQNDYNPHSGTYNADIEYDFNQDEWLLTPEMNLSEGTLTVWSGGSVYWCRDTYDNCDLNVWIVVDEVGGGDDILVKTLDEDWSGSWAWDQSTMDLTSLLPGGLVRIGFQYIGDDGAEAYIDDVVLDGVEGADVPWLSEDPTAGSVPPDSTVSIAVSYDATGLTLGDYMAILSIKNAPNPKLLVPVTLHVVEELPTYSFYLPLMLK